MNRTSRNEKIGRFRESVLESDTRGPPSTGVRITMYFAFWTFVCAILSERPRRGGDVCQTDDVGQGGGGVGVQKVSFC